MLLIINISDNLRLTDATYVIRILTMEDKDILLQLCKRCSDHFYMHKGEEADEEDVHEIFKDLPPGKGYDDKFVLGIINEKARLVGVIDLVRDYLVKGEWIIGLLLLDPSERANGLGRKINDYVSALALKYQATKLRIGVIEDNEKGYGFWRYLGYYEISRVIQKRGKKDHVILVMNKDIAH